MGIKIIRPLLVPPMQNQVSLDMHKNCIKKSAEPKHTVILYTKLCPAGPGGYVAISSGQEAVLPNPSDNSRWCDVSTDPRLYYKTYLRNLWAGALEIWRTFLSWQLPTASLPTAVIGYKNQAMGRA